MPGAPAEVRRGGSRHSWGCRDPPVAGRRSPWRARPGTARGNIRRAAAVSSGRPQRPPSYPARSRATARDGRGSISHVVAVSVAVRLLSRSGNASILRSSAGPRRAPPGRSRRRRVTCASTAGRHGRRPSRRQSRTVAARAMVRCIARRGPSGVGRRRRMTERGAAHAPVRGRYRPRRRHRARHPGVPFAPERPPAVPVRDRAGADRHDRGGRDLGVHPGRCRHRLVDRLCGRSSSL
jgi:hypothetical protein